MYAVDLEANSSHRLAKYLLILDILYVPELRCEAQVWSLVHLLSGQRGQQSGKGFQRFDIDEARLHFSLAYA